MAAWSDRRRSGVRISPVFLVFVGLAGLGGVLAWSDTRAGLVPRLGVFLLVMAGWVVSLCLHEFAHAYVAYRSGDTSVEAAGYLTLNPFRYAHPFLSIVLPVLFIAQGGIGLPGGAVYLHPHAFRSRARQSLAAAVGPLMNVVCALVVLVVVRGHPLGGPHDRFWAGLAFLGFVQISAAVLNLLPVPGLDGYSIIEPYLAAETQRSFAAVKPWGMLGVYVLLQISQLNAWFFDLVERLYDASGAPRLLWAFGYELLKFWQNRSLG
jgi:Zn-dependent protease